MLTRGWSLVVGIVLAALLAGGPVHATQQQLDLPGTYLIEVASGRTIHLGRGALVAWAPDSLSAAVAEVGGESPLPHLRLVRIADGDVREIALSDKGEINHLRWAPDGALLAFTLTRLGRDPGPALLVVDPTSGIVRELVRSSVGEITWTPDSTGITAITLDEAGGSIVTFDARTGDVRETIPDTKDATCQRGLAWSPDGQYLAYAGPGLREGCGDVGNWGVWSWHPATRTTRQLFRGAADEPQWLANGEVVAVVSEPQPEDVPPLTIMRLPPDGAPPQPIAHNVTRMFPQPPRLLQIVGNTVLFPVSTCDVGEAYLWSPDRVELIRQTPEEVFAYRPALAPDGRGLAYVRVGEQPVLVTAPFATGAERVLVSSAKGLQVGTAGPWDAGGDWSPDGTWIAIEVTPEQFRDCAE